MNLSFCEIRSEKKDCNSLVKHLVIGEDKLKEGCSSFCKSI